MIRREELAGFLAGVACGGAVIALLFAVSGMATSEATAAWVQAFGSIAAIIFAVYIANRERRDREKEALEARKAKAFGLYTPLLAELRGFEKQLDWTRDHIVSGLERTSFPAVVDLFPGVPEPILLTSIYQTAEVFDLLVAHSLLELAYRVQIHNQHFGNNTEHLAMASPEPGTRLMANNALASLKRMRWLNELCIKRIEAARDEYLKVAKIAPPVEN